MSPKIARAGVVVLLSVTVAADQSAPATPPAAPAYLQAWTVPIETTHPFSLAVGQSAVFLSHEAGIAAYTKPDGKPLWTQPRSGVTALLGSAVANAPLLCVNGSDLVALDPGTGDVRWTAALTGPPDRTYLAALREGLTVASGTSVRAYRPDGTRAWSATLTSAASTPAVERDGVAWVGTEAPSIVRLDSANGAVLSQTPVPAAPHAIVPVSGEAYVTADSPVLALYESEDTKPSWHWKPKRGLAEIVGAPVIGEISVFVTALDNTLQALDRGGGSVRWRQPLPSRPAPGLRESGGFLFIPLITGEVVRLSPVDGSKSPFAEMTLARDSRLQAFQLADDGAVFAVTVSARAQALTVWRPAPPAKPPQHP
jgi:outer membrane protein assembly factor BamB